MRWAVMLVVLGSGCLVVPGSMPEPSATTESKRATDLSLPGVVLDAVLNSTGSRHAVHATARNQGPNTFYVSSICIPPWSELVEDASGRDVWPPPQYYCQAFGRAPFGPGARMEHVTFWNETVHDAARGETDRAAPGDYVWTVGFRAAKERESGEESRVALAFSIRVA